jgi:hypothetical protein
VTASTAIQSALRAFSLHNAQKCVNSGQIHGSRSLNMNRRLSLPASCGQIIPIFSGTTRSGTFRVAKRTANSNACSLALQSLTISPVRLLVGERKLQAKSGQGTWFGTRGSEVQILSPRPTFSMS